MYAQPPNLINKVVYFCFIVNYYKKAFSQNSKTTINIYSICLFFVFCNCTAFSWSSCVLQVLCCVARYSFSLSLALNKLYVFVHALSNVNLVARGVTACAVLIETHSRICSSWLKKRRRRENRAQKTGFSGASGTLGRKLCIGWHAGMYVDVILKIASFLASQN